MLNLLSVSYNKGKGISTVGFMFACPGKKEMDAKRVVSGATGKNLDKLLAILAASEDDNVRKLFPSPNRYDYLITNASDQVHYPALDGTSLPSRREYQDSDNLARIRRELIGIEYLIAFGEQARSVSKLLKDPSCPEGPIDVHIIHLPHLSLLSLNQIPHDREGNRIVPGTPNATELRLQVIAAKLEKELSTI